MSENKTKQINVNILGKGEEKIKVEEAETIGDLRRLLALDPDVQATDSQGVELDDKTSMNDLDDISFIPNVEGGK